ncbi:hypothetical protein B0O99DRAFT_35974 [Bisporella sp. PMI_857]|nr:hypothetical protein B0O99DRAFT_35974 [Bisporella sp. PMI_857]
MDWHIDIRFYMKTADVMIDFHDEKKALAYTEKNPAAKISKINPARTYQKNPANLNFIRPCKSEKNTLIFQFSNETAAEIWHSSSALGELDLKHCEVSLKGSWDEGELDTRLGLLGDISATSTENIDDSGGLKREYRSPGITKEVNRPPPVGGGMPEYLKNTEGASGSRSGTKGKGAGWY